MGYNNKRVMANHFAKKLLTASVQDFGAKGDGSTDDTLAINNAISFVNKMGGGVVNVPAGTYMVNTTSNVDMQSNVELHLMENATIKGIQSTASFTAVVYVAAGVSNVKITGEGDSSVIDANRYASSGSYQMGINCQGASNITIKNLKVQNAYYDGISVGSEWSTPAYCQDVYIDKTTVYGCGRNGMCITSAINCFVTNCEVSYTGYNDDYREYPCNGINFEMNVNTAYLYNCWIVGNYVHHNGYPWVQWYCFGILVGLGNAEYPVNEYLVYVYNNRCVDNGRDVDSEQIDYTQIDLYNSDARWASYGEIYYSDNYYT